MLMNLFMFSLSERKGNHPIYQNVRLLNEQI